MEMKNKKELLEKLLIRGFYPISKVFIGDLEKDHGIRLVEICRKPYNGGLKYKPSHESSMKGIKWLFGDKVLSWGSNTGWNVTEDCKIALCRVAYDDYINFEITFINE